MLDRSDALSVDSLVQEDGGKSFFIYKPMGVYKNDFPKAEVEDFMLGFMNEKQRKVLVDCMQSPISTLCIDSTHGTNAYQIKLTTLMTINSLGSGVPVAFFFSTKEYSDSPLHHLILYCLYDCGIIFMQNGGQRQKCLRTSENHR